MEALSTAAALANLVDVSIKVSKAAKVVVQSFVNAPAELLHLASKLDHMHLRINQIRCLFSELPTSESLVLLPPEHQAILSTCLQSNLDTLGRIQSACCAQTKASEKIGTRLRWATLDKKKADRMLREVTLAESELNIVVAILGVRISSLNRTSLEALRASQALFHTDLKKSTESIRAWMHTEIQGLADGTLNISVNDSKADDGLMSNVDQCRFTMAKSSGKGTTKQADNTFNEQAKLASLPKAHAQESVKGNEQREDPHLQSNPKVFPTQETEGEHDPGMRLIEYDMKRSLVQYSVKLGNLREPSKDNTMHKPHFGGLLAIQTKRNRRKVKAVFNIGFRLLCEHVFQFELKVQQVAGQWVPMPKFECSIAVFNVRPSDSPIFLACQRQDIHQVRYLLECGQASIFDVDNKVGGLLEHTVQGDYKQYWYTFNKHDQRRMRAVVDYLQDQGCDPNAFYGRITEERLPAALFAFDRGYSSIFSTMLAKGADIISYGSILAGCLFPLNAGLHWKMQLLREMGFSDWNADSTLRLLSNNLLYGACREANLEEVMFALEIAGINPKITGRFGRTPLGEAARMNFLKGAAILVETGAEVNSDEGFFDRSPLLRGLESSSGWLTDTSHFLLLHKANPRLKTPVDSAWNRAWDVACDAWRRRTKSWSFIDLEGGLAHLLLHGSDPFETLNRRCDSNLCLRAPEIARSWSYGLRWEYWDEAVSEEEEASRWISKFTTAEERPAKQYEFAWSEFGRIYLANCMKYIPREVPHQSWDAVGGETSIDLGLTRSSERDQDIYTPLNALKVFLDQPGSFSDDPDDDWLRECALVGRTENECKKQTFFKNQTQFYHHINSGNGRRKLSRFPMVVALCDALQFAGYRAEMDDEGNIWYDPEDGDRYFDAREYQPVKDVDDCDPAFCPICQDFEGYGLGHVLSEAGEARRELREYRDKVKARKRGYF